MFRPVAVATALALALGASAVQAVTVSSNLVVSTTVPAACSFNVAPSAMSFAAYTGASNVDATSTMQITCSSGLSYTVFVTTSTGTRAMNTAVPGPTPLNYELYTDSGRTTVFPSTAAGATAQTGNGSGQALTIYGRIPSGQTVPIGAYSQTVTVNVDY